MSFAPLLAAPLPIQLHAWTAMAAFLLGLAVLARPKGTATHKAMGRIWVALMLVVAISAFWIHELNQFMGFSWIHLLSIVTCYTLFMAILHIRRGNVQAHRYNMLATFLGALVIAGLFTFLPGRIMHRVMFGG
ncbi:DUF2306 domain-containing protein [Oceanibaculum pacificum]|uniref:DUF2306 domain-containing protein n=1 Tax=Oceanibaculum pacificum TaxID=580166 RepID=A0A154VQL0_9PROT|nr:DUF2306 domain-containing protein [Oceanibaculum pacificum]KZD03518.1 hypothetical protein AUP43_12695 [Oceanibaculum pacificum]